jgi:hypothetical protein
MGPAEDFRLQLTRVRDVLVGRPVEKSPEDEFPPVSLHYLGLICSLANSPEVIFPYVVSLVEPIMRAVIAKSLFVLVTLAFEDCSPQVPTKARAVCMGTCSGFSQVRPIYMLPGSQD